MTGTGSLGTLGSAVTGGRGGDGGYAAVIGNDGTGGFGLLFTNAAGATFTVNAAVQGGAGGVGDPWRGPGAGGAGIVGQNLSIIMGVAGSVAGAPDANAIVFTGGANKLTFTKATTGLTGNIGVTGSLTFDQSGIDTTVGNVITGGGSVVKTGTHTITLSGANSYTGGTTVNTGTLALTGSGTLGATTNAVTLNGATAVLGLGGTTQTQDGGVVLQGGGTIQNGTLASAGTFALQSGTVSAALAGMGGVSKTTGGTVILSGNNTYAGGTAINGGTLAVSADANLGNGAGALGFGGGTLQFNGSFATNRAITLNVGGGTFDTNGNAAALSGSIGGTDGLTKTGTGTLIFSGNNSYSGATSVNAGALRAGAVNTFASGSAFTVASGAALDLNNFGQTIGSLAGGGTVTLGSAALTAGGDNTSTTFAGGLGGTGGSLVKTGTGTLLLTATSLYSGATTVSAGTLVVNGDIASSSGITVNAGARLAGTGTVGATLINSGGMFGPGSGTPGSSMTVAGNLAFQSGALYLVQVDPSNASRANVTAGGSATLAGTAVAAFAPGSYVTRSYTILSATGGLGGSTFDALTTSNLPVGFTARLGYTNSDVILNLTARLAPAGVSGSQPNIAVTLNDFFNGGGALPPAFLPVFGLTGGSLGNALSQLSGEAATGARQSAFQLGGQFLNLMLDPFVDGRGGAGGPAIGFATARAPLPDEIALAFAKAMKAPVTEAPPPGFAQRWSAWGGGFGGASRSSGDPGLRQPRSFRAHRRFCRRPRLSPDAGHGGRLRARRRRHQLEPRAGAGWRQERCLPGRRLRHNARGSGLSRHRLRLCTALDVDRPHRLRGRPSHRCIRRAEFWRTHRGRLSHHHDARRLHALCGAAGAKLPHALLSRDRPDRRRLRARLRCPHRHCRAQRAGRPLRSCRGARSHSAADAARPPRLGARLGFRSVARRRLPDAAGHELHRQRRRAGEGFRARLGQRGAAFRQRDRATGQARRRIRRARHQLCRHRHRALRVVRPKAEGARRTTP